MSKRLLASVILVLVCGFGAGLASAQSFYNPVGPQTNVPLSTVTSGGWTQCFMETYATSGTSLATVQSQCSGPNLMMACRQTGSPTLQVLAQAPRADVLFDTGLTNTPHDANGAGWYFNSSYSWGFALQGDALSRSSCDTGPANTSSRLCWHTNGGNLNGGWSCGADRSLNSSVAFERLMFQGNGGVAALPIPTLNEWMMVLLAGALAVSAFFLRRRSRY